MNKVIISYMFNQQQKKELKMDYLEINARIATAKKTASETEYSNGKIVNYNKALDQLMEDIEKADGKEISDYDCQKIADARNEVR